MSFDECSSRETPVSYGPDQNNCAVGADTLGSRERDDNKKPRDRKCRRSKKHKPGPGDKHKEL